MRRVEPPSRTPGPASGFSLVELLVAMVFVLILMSGLAAVFKSSLGTFVTAAEKTSAGRENRLALEQLFDDLNQTGLTASSIIAPPITVTSANPPFFIVPNVPYGSTDVPSTLTPVNGGQNAWAVTDQLVLYYEKFEPYETTMGTAMNGTAVAVKQGLTLATALTGGVTPQTLQFNSDAQAANAASDFTTANNAGMGMMLVSSAITLPVASLTAAGSGGTANLTFGSSQTASNNVPAGSKVNLIVPNQYVCYSIKPMLLDPSQPTVHTPCLVRDLITYPANSTTPLTLPWTSTITSSIIADNVTGFHVGVSVNGGASWAGINSGTGTWSTTNAAWTDLTGPSTGAAAPQINYQLGALDTTASPLPNVSNSLFWFRSYPTMVRVDIQTRTLKSRTEYGTPNAAGAPQAAYNYQTRTLILNPRHFGLTY